MLLLSENILTIHGNSINIDFQKNKILFFLIYYIKLFNYIFRLLIFLVVHKIYALYIQFIFVCIII